MLEIDEQYRPVLTVHDAVVCVAPQKESHKALGFIMDKMNKAPIWAKDLPVTCEGNFAENYGNC